MKKTRAGRNDNRRLVYFICFFVMLAGAVLLPVLLKAHTQVQYKSIYSGHTVGEIAEKNVYAKTSIQLIDHDATEKKLAEVEKAVLPVFSYSSTTSFSVIAKADKIRTAASEGDLAYLGSIVGDSMARQIITLPNLELFSVAYDMVNEIINIGYYDIAEINTIMEEGYDSITLSNKYSKELNTFEHTIYLSASFFLSTQNIREYLEIRLSDVIAGFSAKEGIILEDLILSLIEPNIRYDETLTEQRRSDARDAADPVVISIERGQLLIEADHVVTHAQMDLLDMLSTQSNSFSLMELIGNIIFDAIIIATGLYIFELFLGEHNLHFTEHHILLVSSFIISLIAAYFFTLLSSMLNLEFSDSFLPVFFLPVFMSEITGLKRVGFISLFMFSSVMATIPTASLLTFFYCMTCGSACVLLIRFFNRRMDVLYQWFFSSITCSGVTILFIFVNQSSLAMVFTVLLGTLINVAIAYILLTALMPLAENLFNLPTVFRLYELAYGESPLLTRLSQAAPGTYSHSMAVADLSEVGAKAIGANPLLARVGALYHDIGKIEHPEYFVENQSGVNKHDEISPSLSVAVIKSHVKVGADKGREIGLPLEVIKIIGSHHGNDVIAYFYNEAMKLQAASNSDRGETVKASDFSYNADIPDFRECGIVMLADSIEAASRTVTPNASKYAKLIDSIFMGKIERGQLDNSNLTMNDIKTLADTFVKTLVARNHSRIEYPDED